MADVVVTTPTAQSYVDQGADTSALKAATINENAKCAKYASLAADEGKTFSPLAFESYGAWGKKAIDLFVKLAEMVADRSYGGMVSRGEWLEHARRMVAIALVKGNGRLVRNALQLALRGEIRRVRLDPRTGGLRVRVGA